MVPMFLRRPKGYITLHYNFMFWSAVGLYGVFLAETAVRLLVIMMDSGRPSPIFYLIVEIAVFIVTGAATIISRRKDAEWSKFDKNINP